MEKKIYQKGNYGEYLAALIKKHADEIAAIRERMRA